MAVKAGAPKPDISTVDAFRRALLAAKSIAYSDSASGEYLSTTLFRRIGVYDEIKDKARKIPAEPVAKVVARGEAEIGFQPVSELRPFKGADIVGPIPDELQIVNVFAAGIAKSHATGGRQGAHRVSGFPGRKARHRGERHAVRGREKIAGARRSGVINSPVSTPPCRRRGRT
jgi:hypothetical protein